MSTIRPDELETLFHPLMNSPARWIAVRYEIDIDYSTGQSESIVIVFRSSSGEQKRLKFAKPVFEQFGPLGLPSAQNLYVADLSSLGWTSDRHIEVGEWEEERSTVFWASSVEEIA